MSYFKAYLFDLDGTLVDTAAGYEQLLFELEWIKSPLDNTAKYLSGVDVRALIDYLFYGVQIDIAERTQFFLDYYSANLHRSILFYPGALDTLETLKKHKLVVGIVSNRNNIYCQQIQKIYDLNLDIFMGSGIIPYRKPHPAPLLYAANKLNLKTTECFYLGDMPTDLHASHLALMHAAYCRYGCFHFFDPHFHYRQEIDSLEDITKTFLHRS